MPSMSRPKRMLVLLLAGLVGAGAAFANPPVGSGGVQRHERKARQERDQRHGASLRSDDVGHGTRMGRAPLKPGAYFNDRTRDAVHAYYAAHPVKPCPPRKAGKRSGCLPPGQARQWQIGETLPSTAVVAPVPRQVVVKLPRVPPGHRYVQVAGDILLVAAGSKMVVDAIDGSMR